MKLLKKSFFFLPIIIVFMFGYQPNLQTAPAQQAQPLPTPNAGVPALPPGVTPEKFAAMENQVNDFFAQITPEQEAEIEKLFQDPEFQKFVQDVEKGLEKGEISFDDLFGPEEAKPAQPQPKPKEKGFELPPSTQPEIQPEKQKAPALRNKQAAQAMLKDILNHIASLRTKAGTYHKVADTLAPWKTKLDLLTHYIHVLSKNEHLDRLISDQEFLSLHDTLRDFNTTLRAVEPQIEVPEFGLVEQKNQAQKERSKRAFNSLISNFEKLFQQKQVIAEIEKMLKKHEPTALKKRKEIEATEERAKKEAEEAKSLSPAHARIKREAEYAPRNGGNKFYDWFYTPESRGRSTYSGGAPYEERPSSTKGAEPSKGGGGKGGGKGGAKDGKDKKEEEKKEGKAAAATVPSSTKEIIDRIKRLIGEIKESFDFIATLLKKDVVIGLTAYLDAPAAADATRVAAEGQKWNDIVNEVARALHTIKKQNGIIEGLLKKLSTTAQKSHKDTLNKIFAKNKSPLETIYNASLSLFRKGVAPASAATFRTKLLMHGQSLTEFQTVYELIYKPKEEAERKELLAKIMTALQPPAAPAGGEGEEGAEEPLRGPRRRGRGGQQQEGPPQEQQQEPGLGELAHLMNQQRGSSSGIPSGLLSAGLPSGGSSGY